MKKNEQIDFNSLPPLVTDAEVKGWHNDVDSTKYWLILEKRMAKIEKLFSNPKLIDKLKI